MKLQPMMAVTQLLAVPSQPLSMEPQPLVVVCGP